MAVVILSHPVADYKTWKPYYDADVDRRTGAGLKEITVGQDSENPNMVYMVFETDNPGVVQQMLSDRDMAKTMKEAGVTAPPKAVIIQ